MLRLHGPLGQQHITYSEIISLLSRYKVAGVGEDGVMVPFLEKFVSVL
jgi:hypothetical protein